MTDKDKRYVKEYEFVGGDAAERTRQMIESAKENLFVVEYDGNSIVKLPMLIVAVAGGFGLLFAFPFTIAVIIGLTVLGFLTKLSIRVQSQQNV